MNNTPMNFLLNTNQILQLHQLHDEDHTDDNNDDDDDACLQPQTNRDCRRLSPLPAANASNNFNGLDGVLLFAIVAIASASIFHFYLSLLFFPSQQIPYFTPSPNTSATFTTMSEGRKELYIYICLYYSFIVFSQCCLQCPVLLSY